MDGLAERADPDRHQRAAVLVPVVHAGCASLLRAMDDIGEAACARALASMAADPTETILYEMVRGARAWDAYQAGGPLQAQHAELLIGPEVAPLPAGVAAMLRTLADAGRCRIEATGDPWRVLLHAPGVPEASAMVLPRSGQAEDFLVQVCIGSNRLLALGMMPPGLIRRMWQQTGFDAVPAAVPHPQTSPKVVVRSPKLVVVAEPGIEHEAQALFLAHLSLAKTPVPAGAPAVVVIGENLDLTEALMPHVVVTVASGSGDAGAALAEALSSQARVVVLDGEALGVAALSLPWHVERRQHRVTLAVMPGLGDDEAVVELARRLDALVVLVEEAATGISRRPSGTALLAGMLKRAGVLCQQVTPVPAPPVPLGMITYELWSGRGDRDADC